jgi:catechol 2,3-dioxygenase-like lactoylglutathione lyase family enzyme
MAVQVYGVNHVGIEVDDAKKAVAFYEDVFGLKMLTGGEGAAWCQLGYHQFLAIFEVEQLQPDRAKHFGLIVRDEGQLDEVRRKVREKYGLPVLQNAITRCDFSDPWGNHIQVVYMHDESLVWLLPYGEVQKAGVVFSDDADKSAQDPPLEGTPDAQWNAAQWGAAKYGKDAQKAGAAPA